jgi:hypothetical protein
MHAFPSPQDDVLQPLAEHSPPFGLDGLQNAFRPGAKQSTPLSQASPILAVWTMTGAVAPAVSAYGEGSGVVYAYGQARR